jgi:Protein of unknown function (DUF3054)
VRTRVLPALLDVASIVLFAALGRASHAEGVTATGVASVAWPFLAAAALGWLLARRRPGWPASVRVGVVVWPVTVVLGLALRVATGGGFAVSFGLVTLVVLGVLLLGWRAVGAVVARTGTGAGGRRRAAETDRRRA